MCIVGHSKISTHTSRQLTKTCRRRKKEKASILLLHWITKCKFVVLPKGETSISWLYTYM